MVVGPTSNEVSQPTDCGPWWGAPSLSFARELPYVLVMTVLTYPYTRLGLSAIVIGYTSWLGLPWTLKPLWSPVVELIGNERRWIWMTEYLASVALLAIGLGYSTSNFLLWTILGYALLAALSA